LQEIGKRVAEDPTTRRDPAPATPARCTRPRPAGRKTEINGEHRAARAGKPSWKSKKATENRGLFEHPVGDRKYWSG
jgi:hypothetical protein